MQPVLPSTMVRGPAALTINFITRADSHPWHVRWPEVKYSSSGTFLTPLKGSSCWVGSVSTASISAHPHKAHLLPFLTHLADRHLHRHGQRAHPDQHHIGIFGLVLLEERVAVSTVEDPLKVSVRLRNHRGLGPLHRLVVVLAQFHQP